MAFNNIPDISEIDVNVWKHTPSDIALIVKYMSRGKSTSFDHLSQ